MTGSGIISVLQAVLPRPAGDSRRAASNGSFRRVGAMRPKLYTISSDRPFLAVLANGLLGSTGGDPLALPRMTVLLPPRRAVRALREAFLRALPDDGEPGRPLLLPRMRP